MGKKKTTIKFIDKKKAISFHLVAKANHADEDSENERAEDEERERAELKAQLRAQRAEDRAAAGLPPLDEPEDDDDEGFIPKPAADDRIQLMNLAAEAEGVETRAVRQARKALKESQKQKFYLQPNFVPGENGASLPADFPAEQLYTGAVDRDEEAYWAREDRRKWELERQAAAPALLPHNYDYEKHLRPMSGRGVFMEAKRGDELYDAEHDPRDMVPKPVKKDRATATAASSSSSAGPAAAASASSSSAGSSSLSLHDEAKGSSGGGGGEEYQDDDDMPPLGTPGGGPDDEEAPVNPALLASIERLQRKLVKQGRRVRAEKDFVAALEGEQQEEFEQLQDDFVLQAMMGEGGKPDEDDEEEEEEEDEEEFGEYEEYYEDEEDEDGEEEEGDEEKFDEEGNPIPRAVSKAKKPSAGARRRAAAEDDDAEDFEDEEDEDEDGDDPKDAAFAKLLEDEYSDGEMGELDQLAEEDPEALEGHLDLEDVEGEIDEFLGAKDKFASEGGAVVDTVAPELQALTLSKLALVTRGEKSLKEIEQEMTAMLDPPVRDTWDAESILSTYSNTENHPRVLREQRRSRGSGASSQAGGRQQLPAFQAPLPIPERALRRDAAAAAAAASSSSSALAHDASADHDDDDAEEFEDDDDLDEAATAGGGGGENKGRARATDETPEEKKKRKQAVKLAKREAKGRKKQLKTLYATETAAAVAKQAKLNKANPPGIKKL